MGASIDHRNKPMGVRALAGDQHGVVDRAQLLERGFSAKAIRHRIARGRLFPVHPGVYAVGRKELSRLGELMAAVLVCGEGARLSHETAAELYEIRRSEPPPIHVSVPMSRRVRHRGIEAHRRLPSLIAPETTHRRIPVTPLPLVLIDLAATNPTHHVERAINLADAKGHMRPAQIHAALDDYPRVAGVVSVRALLDKDAFLLTGSVLEQRFLALIDRAGLPRPKTQGFASGHRCDFIWPELNLVAETDGLRYHRTATEQRRDRERDHAHLLAGRESVRFTHWQVANEPGHVVIALRAAARKSSALRAAA